MKKTLISLALACLLAVSLAVPAAAAFSDVPSTAWYAGDVNDVQKYGVIVGVGNNRFDPNGTLTLAQAVTMAARVKADGDKNIPAGRNPSPWYQPYADYAADNGICKPGEFGDYNAPCSRLTMAALFYRVFPKATERDRNNVTFLPDLDNNEKTAPVFYLYRQGVLTGNDSLGTFEPQRTITRAETAAILNRVLDASKRKTVRLDKAAQLKSLLTKDHVWEASASTAVVYDPDRHVTDTREQRAALVFQPDGTVYGTFFLDQSGDISRCRGTWKLGGETLTMDLDWDRGGEGTYTYQVRYANDTLFLSQTSDNGFLTTDRKGSLLVFRKDATFARPWGTSRESMQEYVTRTWGLDLGL